MPRETYSAIEPTWYFLDEIQPKEGIPCLILRVNWDIREVEVQEPNLHNEWQYKSVIIGHRPAQDLEVTDVRSYIETHESELKAEALSQWNNTSLLTMDIAEVRNQPLVPLLEEKVFTEKEVYGAKITEIDVTRPDKRYLKVELLNRDVTKWCHVTGSVYRDYTESKIKVGDVVMVLYDPDNKYPVIVDRVVL